MLKNALILLVLVLPQLGLAQITVTNADMPSANDLIRFSLAPPSTVVNLTQAGANATWDFSGLVAQSQDIDSFLSVSSAPLTYLFAFGFTSNLYSRGEGLNSIAGVQFSDVQNFYNKSTTSYRQTGFGANVNGLPTPIVFGNDDFIYRFPLVFGDIDTSDSDYSLVVPGLAAVSGEQRRISVVDGWGSLTTPYGTFNTLRVVSTLTGEDSVFLDTLGFGFTFPRPLTREYKWIANGQDIPVLQINTTQQLFGQETVSRIKYRDSLRVFTGLEAIRNETLNPLLYPNPTTDNTTIRFQLMRAGWVELSLVDVSGRIVYQRNTEELAGEQQWLLPVCDQRLSNGVYAVRLRTSDGVWTGRLIKN
ncbi:MAG: T9SS type A sorting domain-containing protein [Sphingobacteriales bacterium]|nr:T9SS type A sorting domain-containing protein [Sphingobacteriales bacterium]